MHYNVATPDVSWPSSPMLGNIFTPDPNALHVSPDCTQSTVALELVPQILAYANLPPPWTSAEAKSVNDLGPSPTVQTPLPSGSASSSKLPPAEVVKTKKAAAGRSFKIRKA